MDEKLLKEFWRDSGFSQWTDGRFAYATNGSIFIRFDKLQNGFRIQQTSGTELTFDEDDSNFVELTKIKSKKCPVCDGSGELKECPECEGTGNILFENDYNTYDLECQSCYGVSTRCPDCIKGVIFEKNSCKIGIACVSPWNIYLISKLAKPKISKPVSDGLKIIPFSFEGGRGYVMSVRMGSK